VTALLEIDGLRVAFASEEGGEHAAVDGIDLAIAPGEFVGVVGESGSGKSVTALAAMGLIQPPGRVAAGSIRFAGRDLRGLPEREWQKLRGREMAMIFQEPMSSLNPVFPVGEQIAEVVRRHERVSARAARARAIEMLTLVGIPDPARRVDGYPHHFSGGMRQRVMIAIALACNPRLLIADEATTALDVTVQAQILDLLRRLRERLGLAVLLITHDLGVVAELVERVYVMYAGRIVETSPTAALFTNPAHPYTRGLLASIPSLDTRRARLPAIEGTVPMPGRMPSGCRFAPRCSQRLDACVATDPPLAPRGPRHAAACLLPTAAAR
jgi:oligopeptide/dipeptide ABC transporter ATP-binding protein